MTGLVIIGNGPAAHRLVERLHARGFDGSVTVLGAERRPAYNRALLPRVLDGTLTADLLDLAPPPSPTRVHRAEEVTGIDRDGRVVRTRTGRCVPYDRLVLATGARPRPSDLPGTRTPEGGLAERVVTVRTPEDCAAVAAYAGAASIDAPGRAVVLGAGLLGVEVAHALVRRGVSVTLVGSEATVLGDHLDRGGARFLVDRLRAAGVDVRTGSPADSYRPGELLLADGESLPLDVLVVCHGSDPDTDLASGAGLAVGRGVLVDDRLTTSDERIHAIGDCAEHRDAAPGRITRAWRHADALAAILTQSTSDIDGPGGRDPVRLNTRGIELGAFGSPRALDDPDSDVELVTLSDPTRGRYAKLALRADRPVAAVLIGLSTAIATLTHLHDRDLPAPADRLAMLLGSDAPTRTATAGTAEHAVLCQCNNVTRQALVQAFRSGATDVPALAAATRATTGCGGCTEEIGELCRTLHETPTPTTEGA